MLNNFKPIFITWQTIWNNSVRCMSCYVLEPMINNLHTDSHKRSCIYKWVSQLFFWDLISNIVLWWLISNIDKIFDCHQPTVFQNVVLNWCYFLIKSDTWQENQEFFMNSQNSNEIMSQLWKPFLNLELFKRIHIYWGILPGNHWWSYYTGRGTLSYNLVWTSLEDWVPIKEIHVP